MLNKLLFVLGSLLLNVAIAFGDGQLFLIDSKVDTDAEVATINQNFSTLFTGKLDIKPGNVIPRGDSQYNLGASGTEWSTLFVDTVTAANISSSLLTASSASITVVTVSTLSLTGTAAAQNQIGANNVIEAWVHFTSTGTLFIRGSYNVTSVTDNGVGDFTINYTRAFEDVNYSIVGTAMYNAVPPIVCINNGGSNVTVSTTKVYIINPSNANIDSSMISIMVVR